MAAVQIQAPDGSIVEFPEGTPDTVMSSAMAKAYPKPTKVSVPEDVAKSAGSGLIAGAGSVLSAPRDIASLAYRYLVKEPISRVGEATGAMSPEDAQAYRDRPIPAQTSLVPTQGDVGHSITRAADDLYTPQTKAGQYAHTAAEFVPGAIAMGPGAATRGILARGAAPIVAGDTARAAAGNALEFGALPGTASQAAGDATEGTPYQGVARVAAALIAPSAAGIARRVVTPLPISPERQAMVDVLAREGVPVTAGQATGNKPLRYMESALGDMPGSGGGAHAAEEAQRGAYTSAALRRVGEDAQAATPDVLQGARDRIGSQFEQLAGRNTMGMDAQFAQDVTGTLREYGNVLPSQQRQQIYDMLTDLTQQGANGLPGPVYQETRSRLSRLSNSLRDSDPAYAGVLRGVRNALDGAMNRSVTAADQEAWQTARGQWGNLRTVEKAAAGAGENASMGNISPGQLRMAVSGGNRSGYARGQGDLNELSHAGNAIMTPLPQSGTGPRMHIEHIVHALAGLGGYAAGGAEGAAAALAATVGGPALAGRLLMSRPAQAYLSNQTLRAPERAAGSAAIAQIANAIEERQRRLENRR